MRGRHHIYNFHIGFWGAFLVSLALIIHSAVLLVASAGVSVAQTAPFITLNAPDQGQVFQEASQLSLSATTNNLVSSLTFNISNPALGINDNVTGNPDASFQTFTAVYNLGLAGDYNVSASAVNPQTGLTESAQVTITVASGTTVTIGLGSPATGSTISGNVEFKATTNTQVDGVRFELTPDQGTNTVQFTGNPTANNEWTFDFDSTAQQDGDYQIEAIATLSGAETRSQSASVTIQNQTQQSGTFTLDTPDQGESIQGNYDLNGTASNQASNVSFQITPGATAPQDIIPASNSAGNSLNFNASLNTTQYTNGNYTVIIFGTINGQTVFSPPVSITISNQVVTTNPPAITTTVLPNGQVGLPYNATFSATDGTAPLVWSLAAGAVLPPTLTLSSGGVISGVPTQSGTFNISVTVTDLDSRTAQTTVSLVINAAPPPPASCGDGTVDAGEQCDDGNNVNGDGCSSICTNEQAPPQPQQNTPASLTIAQPNAGAQIQGSSSLVVINGSEAINEPTVLLTNQAGQNVLSGVTTNAFQPVNNNGGSTWHYLLDTTPYENGPYNLRIVTTAADDGATLNAGPIAVTINNPVANEGPTFEGGRVVRPTEGEPASGIVLLQAEITGTIRTVSFRLQTVSDGTKIVNGQFNQGKGLWEATWNSTGINAGPVILRTDIVTEDGQQATLPVRNFAVIAQTAPVIAPTPEPLSPLPQPRPEEIIPPEVLENVTPDGEIAETPIECQVVGITNEQECDEYLASRAIRILDEGEQEAVQNQLDQLVTRHIEFGEGRANQRDFSAPAGDSENLSQPLSEILPINQERARESAFLVAPSTKPPTNISRFVEQTVDAVLIADRDGDGLPDEAEERYGTDPDNPDTDGDGFNDGQEVKNGFSPTGSGLLAVVAAPTDIAILNNRPLDQPRFAGVTEETILVEEVQSREVSEEEAILEIRGKAEPSSFVTLYIYSSLPVVVTVQANQSGEWEYDFTHPLVDGKHEVYATVTNDTGKIVKKSRPLSFFVQEAKAVNEADFLNASLTVQDTSSTFLAYYMVGGILIVLLGGVMFFYYLRAQKGFA